MAGNRRKVRDECDARELLDAWFGSGQQLVEFCKLHGVDGRSLNCWRRNLSAASKGEGAPLRLLEVVTPQPVVRAEYRLVVGDVIVQVDDAFRDDTLARLLRVVAAC